MEQYQHDAQFKNIMAHNVYQMLVEGTWEDSDLGGFVKEAYDLYCDYLNSGYTGGIVDYARENGWDLSDPNDEFLVVSAQHFEYYLDNFTDP